VLPLRLKFVRAQSGARQRALVQMREPRLRKQAVMVPLRAAPASSAVWLELAERAAMVPVGVPVSRFLLAQPLSCQLAPRQVQVQVQVLGKASPVAQLRLAQPGPPGFWPECEAVSGRLQAQPRAC